MVLSELDADFERVRRLTMERAEAWLIATDATVTRDADYDAVFLFHDRCYHSQVRVTFSRGHHRFEAFLRYRINARFQVVQGPVVSEWSDERADDGAKERSVEQRIITQILDCGTICQLFIDTGEDVLVLAADGNMFRRAEAACGSLVAMRVAFWRTDWPGGLAWFALVETEERQ